MIYELISAKETCKMGVSKSCNIMRNYCRANQEWQWRNILFTIAKYNMFLKHWLIHSIYADANQQITVDVDG